MSRRAEAFARRREREHVPLQGSGGDSDDTHCDDRVAACSPLRPQDTLWALPLEEGWLSQLLGTAAVVSQKQLSQDIKPWPWPRASDK